MKPLAWLVIAGFALVISGCASIASGTDQTVNVTSVPNAQIEITSSRGQLHYSGRSPAIVVLSRDQTYTVLVCAAGYRESSFVIRRRLNAWYLGNLLVGWIAGFIIDALSGAMWKLEPDVITITLEAITLRGVPTLVAVCSIEGNPGRTVHPLMVDGSVRRSLCSTVEN